MAITLTSGFDPSKPLSISQTSRGETFIVNGVNKPLRWDAFSASVENAGIPAGVMGSMGLVKSTSGSPSISGTYYAAVRYIDDEGIPGDISTAITATVTNSALLTYENIPAVPDAEPRVVSKQLFRSLAGAPGTFYLDKTISVSSTTCDSSQTDVQLAAGTPLPLVNLDGTVHARRFGVPPNFKTVVVSHQERTFWGVDAVLSDGHAEVTSGSATVTLRGAALTDQLVGRKFFVAGHGTEYTISAVSTSITRITLSSVYTGATNPLERYEIRSDTTERNRIYFSENAEPESVPAVNAIDLVSNETDGGIMTCMMSMGAFIWLMTPNRTYRWTFQIHPLRDGSIYPTTQRGCLNQRCWVLVEGNAFILDREGCYIFNGGTVRPISGTIQDLFRPGGGIIWQNAKWFHVNYYYSEETVKFFVCLDGSLYPRHALCYHYRKDSWWVEEYPWPAASSANVDFPPSSRLVMGTSQGRVMLTSSGTLDGISEPIIPRVTAGTVGLWTVSHSGIHVPADVLLSTLSVVAGPGKGQTRTILAVASDDATLTLDREWDVLPVSGESVIQIGGIPWSMKTKWFQFVDAPVEHGRKVRLAYTPIDSGGVVNLSIYKNYDTVASDYLIDYDRLDGVKVIKGYPHVELDINANKDGWMYWSFDDQHDFRGPATRFMQVGLDGVQNEDPIIIHSIGVDGVR